METGGVESGGPGGSVWMDGGRGRGELSHRQSVGSHLAPDAHITGLSCVLLMKLTLVLLYG